MFKRNIKTILIISLSLIFLGGFSVLAAWPNTAPFLETEGGWLGKVFDLINSDENKLVISSDKVGIGTTNPNGILNVAGNDVALNVFANNNQAILNDLATIGTLPTRVEIYGTNGKDGDGNSISNKVFVSANEINVRGSCGITGSACPEPKIKIDAINGKIDSKTLCLSGDCRNTWSSAGITGAGTANYIPKWTSSTAQGNSVIYQNGSNIGIGDNTPDGSLKLDVNGQIGATAYCDQNGNNCQTITNVGYAKGGWYGKCVYVPSSWEGESGTSSSCSAIFPGKCAKANIWSDPTCQCETGFSLTLYFKYNLTSYYVCIKN